MNRTYAVTIFTELFPLGCEAIRFDAGSVEAAHSLAHSIVSDATANPSRLLRYEVCEDAWFLED